MRRPGLKWSTYTPAPGTNHARMDKTKIAKLVLACLICLGVAALVLLLVRQFVI